MRIIHFLMPSYGINGFVFPKFVITVSRKTTPRNVPDANCSISAIRIANLPVGNNIKRLVI